MSSMRRMSLVPVLASTLAVIALGACNRQPAADTSAPPVPAATSTASPAQATVAPAAIVDRTPTFKGYGDLKFGMASKELRDTWKAPLSGTAPANPGGCYLLAPDASAPKSLALMVEGDKLVRYDVGNDGETAPGGGKVGMGIDQIRKLYAGRIREQPAKYVPGATDLRVSADDDSGSALVFETDAGGKVASWRVGQPPAVDYVEGCS
jgi:hypothetical protein